MSISPITKEEVEVDVMSSEDILSSSGIVSESALAAVQEFQFYSKLHSCNNLEEFRELIKAILHQFGFSDFFFAAFKDGVSRHISTFSDDICQRCPTGQYSEQDLLWQHVTTSTKPIYLSSIDNYVASAPFQSDTLLRNRELYKLMGDCGFSDCYIVPRKSPVSEDNVMFATTAKGLNSESFHAKIEQFKPILYLLVEAIAYLGITKFTRYFLGERTDHSIPITQKPLRLLNILAKDNITLKEAAKKLYISLDTANKHIAAAKKALGANTQAAAVYRAMVNGLIEIEQPPHH